MFEIKRTTRSRRISHNIMNIKSKKKKIFLFTLPTFYTLSFILYYPLKSIGRIIFIFLINGILWRGPLLRFFLGMR